MLGLALTICIGWRVEIPLFEEEWFAYRKMLFYIIVETSHIDIICRRESELGSNYIIFRGRINILYTHARDVT